MSQNPNNPYGKFATGGDRDSENGNQVNTEIFS